MTNLEFLKKKSAQGTLSIKDLPEIVNAIQEAKDSITQSGVISVNSRSGAVTLNKSDVDLNNVDNIALAAGTTTGTVVSFETPLLYGSEEAPETGNITFNMTNAKRLMGQVMVHNAANEPTWGGQKVVSGEYVPNVLNYLGFIPLSSTRVLITISQEI